MYKGLFTAPDVHRIAIQLHKVSQHTMSQYYPRLQDNTMQNKVTILA